MYFLYILFAILIFGILIMVHELGHFLTAKLFKVKVNEFSIFMGPAIWKRQRGDYPPVASTHLTLPTTSLV